MKTAIYIEDGTVQLVITPESEFEKNALGSFDKDGVEAKIFNGTFYDCRGGWVRQKRVSNQGSYAFDQNEDDQSLIIRAGDCPDITTEAS